MCIHTAYCACLHMKLAECVYTNTYVYIRIHVHDQLCIHTYVFTYVCVSMYVTAHYVCVHKG